MTKVLSTLYFFSKCFEKLILRKSRGRRLERTHGVSLLQHYFDASNCIIKKEQKTQTAAVIGDYDIIVVVAVASRDNNYGHSDLGIKGILGPNFIVSLMTEGRNLILLKKSVEKWCLR